MAMRRTTKIATSPQVAIAYLRASTDEQRLGPEAQRAAIEAWAAREGVQVAGWYVDQGVCSVTPIHERPALVAALAALREHRAGIFVVAKRDRLARDPMVTGAIERAAESQGAHVVSAAGEGNGESASDLFLRRILDAKAELERADIRARTKAALQAKRAKGERVSARLPYGYALADDGVHLAPVDSEQAVITRARALAEGRSLGKVAEVLAGEGLVSRSGRPFAPMQISRMLRVA
jgi:site-specific DNA recombinase